MPSAVLATAGVLSFVAAFWLYADDGGSWRANVVPLAAILAWGAFSAGRLRAQRRP